MKLQEFIIQEIRTVVESEVQNNEKKNKVIAFIDAKGADILQNLDELQKDLELSNFKELNYSLSALHELDEFDLSLFQKVEILIKQYPNNKIFPLVYLFCYKMGLEEQENLKDELSLIEYFKLIQKFDFLIELDNILFEAELLKVFLELYDKDTLSQLVPVLNEIIGKYPNKVGFRFYLVQVLFQISAYDDALITIKAIQKDWKALSDEDFDGLTEEDNVCLVLTLAKIYDKKNDNESALKEVNWVIDNIPSWEADGEEIQINGFDEAYFLRMKCNMLKQNKEAVLLDYNALKEYDALFEFDETSDEISTPDLRNAYADVLHYVEKNK